MKGLKNFIAREWGSLWLFLFCIPAIFKFLNATYGGHYQIFREASISIWNHQDPYSTHFPYGYFLYHPSSGLYFFGLFNFLEPVFANFTFMLLGFALLYNSMRIACRTFELTSQQKNLFYFLATSEILGSIQNSRLELYILAGIFSSITYLINGDLKKSAFVLAIPSVFKLQAIAFVGLFSLIIIKEKSKIKWIPWTAIFLSLVALSPLAVFNWSEYLHYTHLMKDRLTDYLPQVFASYHHIYRFVTVSTQYEVSLTLASRVGIFVAGIMAFTCFVNSNSFEKKLALAIGLACVYVTSFSLMSQSAAYCLALPLLMIAIRDQDKSKWVRVGIWGSWILISLLSSDLVPRELRTILFNSSIKALGPIWLCAFWMYGSRITSKAVR